MKLNERCLLKRTETETEMYKQEGQVLVQNAEMWQKSNANT